MNYAWVKQTAILFLVALILFAGCKPASKTADFTKMNWLIGTWKAETGEQLFYENWVKVNETEFTNINFSICSGDTVINGHSKIELRNNRIAYTSGSQVWDLKSLTGTQIVFENGQKGEKFTFTNTSNGEWNSVLKYPGSQLDYTLSKTVSIQALLNSSAAFLEGEYTGQLEFAGKNLLTSIRFSAHHGEQFATASTPANLQLNMPFEKVCYNPPFLQLSLRDGWRTLLVNAKVNGDSISGKLAGEIPASLNLKKSTITATRKPNYSIVPVQIKNNGISLPANLFLPHTQKQTGAVIIVSGSGPHIKEEYNGWADLLASKGVAVLTYDKRNVTNYPDLHIRRASSDIVLPGELESDLEAALLLLKNRKEINSGRIGVIGFSQGAVIAPVVAARNPGIAFLVAVSGNVTTDKAFIINQSLNKLRQRNFDSAAISEAKEIMESLFKYVKEKKEGDKIQKRLDKAYERGFGQHSLPRYIPNDDEIKYLSTWNSFEHDPSSYWSKLTIPCYVVYGDKDHFIPVSESVKILDKIFAAKPHLLSTKVYSNYDHFIKNIPDTNVFDFPKFADNYINDLTAWILKHAN